MFIHSKHFFPIVKLDRRLDGYYLDINDNVYTTNGMFGRGYQMVSSAYASSGSDMYFIMNGYNVDCDYLIKLCHNDNDHWEKELGLKDNIDNTPTEINTANKGMVIASVENNVLVLPSKTEIYLTTESWKTEIERLAKLNPGIKYVALSIVTSVTASDLVWE